jgi:hypothetical protein
VPEGIVPGDFVLMNNDWAATVGLVYKIASGHAHVWWYVHEKVDQRPWVVGKEHSVSDLKLVAQGTAIPDSMMMLRSENFSTTPFRIRLS